jgi:hypothetical protein
VRADVAIHRMRAPEEGHSRRLRSRQGSCTKKRRGVPADGAPGRTFSIATGAAAMATSSLGPGTPPGEGPVGSRPTSGRDTDPARKRRTGIAEAFHDAWRGASAMPRPPWTGRQVMVRTTWPSPSMTEASTAEPGRPKPPTPDDPALGRTTAAREHAPTRPDPARQGRAGSAARRFRVLGERLTLVGSWNNRAEGCGSRFL